MNLDEIEKCLDAIQGATEELFSCAIEVIDQLSVERASLRSIRRELGLDAKKS